MIAVSKLWQVVRKIFNRKVIPTSLAWAAFMTLVGWVLVALGWWLLAELWWHELVVPHSVKTTAQAMLLIIFWGGLVFSFFLFWARYNFKRYFSSNKRVYKPLENQGPLLEWSEALFDPVRQAFIDKKSFH